MLALMLHVQGLERTATACLCEDGYRIAWTPLLAAVHTQTGHAASSGFRVVTRVTDSDDDGEQHSLR